MRLHSSKFTFWVKIGKDEFLLVNACYNSMAIVDSEVINLIKDLETAKNSETLKELRDLNFLTDKSNNEEAISAERLPHNAHKVIVVPKHSIILTYNCNLRCTYCYQHSLWSRSKWLKKVISVNQIDAIYEIIKKLDAGFSGRKPLRSISLYGGEPLMQENMEITRYILERGNKLGYNFHTNTNGVNLQDYIDLFKNYTINIGVTIDGLKDLHDRRRPRKDGSGSFTDIVNGVDSAVSHGLFVSVRTNVDRGNIKQLPQLSDFIVEKGWDRLENLTLALSRTREANGVVYPYIMSWDELIREVIGLYRKYPKKMKVFKCEWDDPDISGFSKILQTGTIQTLKSTHCEAHTTAFSYDPYGNIYACPWVIGEKEHTVGTYFPSFKLNENFKVWRNRLIYDLPKCKKCRYSLLCGGGCAVEAYQKWGTIMRESCDCFKAVVNLHVPFLFESQPHLTKMLAC